MSKGSAIVGFILCLLCGMGLMWGIDRGAAGGHGSEHSLSKDTIDTSSFDHSSASVPVTSEDPSWGRHDAPVTIVEFSSFQCGYCKKVVETLDALKKKYGPDKLRVVWKNSAAPRSMPTHVAAMAAYELGGPEAFWKFHDQAFEDMRVQNPENFSAWAVKAGVDKAKFEEALKSKKLQEKVERDRTLSTDLGVRGTPGFFINGVALRGAQPQQKFEEEIDKQLKEAEKLIASGTPKNQVYVTLTNRNNKVQPSAGKPDDKKRQEDTTTVWKVPVVETDPVKGPASAMVTIVEFSEFQCPFCSRVLPTVKKITDTYGDKVRVIWKDNPLPFHKRANAASQFAREAMAQKGIDGFWAAHDMLFENQKKLEDEDLWGYAEKLELDVEKVKEAVSKQKYNDQIEGSQDLAQDFNASGTPHFFINGRRLVGAKSFEEFKTIIDEEIAKAEGLLKRGVKAEDLYAELTKDGKTPPPPEKKSVGPAPKDAPWKGAEDPVVVIHEFSDFQCPFCNRVNDTIKQVLQDYGDKVRVVWRHKPMPFHKQAPLAHEAAQEAYAQKGNQGFWAMHDTLFGNQKKKKPEDGPKDWSPFMASELEGYATAAALDLAKFKAALEGHTHKAFIDEEIAAADKIGIRGTPAFVIGEYFISGAQPYSKFKKLINLALEDAKNKDGKEDKKDEPGADAKGADAKGAAKAPVPAAPTAPPAPPAKQPKEPVAPF